MEEEIDEEEAVRDQAPERGVCPAENMGKSEAQGGEGWEE